MVAVYYAEKSTILVILDIGILYNTIKYISHKCRTIHLQIHMHAHSAGLLTISSYDSLLYPWPLLAGLGERSPHFQEQSSFTYRNVFRFKLWWFSVCPESLYSRQPCKILHLYILGGENFFQKNHWTSLKGLSTWLQDPRCSIDGISFSDPRC